MSVLKLSVPITDYDAAQALLELQNDSHKNQRVDESVMELRENMEDTANLFLSCFITSNVANTVNNRVINENVNTFEKIIIKSDKNSHTMNNVSKSVSKRSRIFKRRPTKIVQRLSDNPTINNCSMSPPVKTRDASTQTDNKYSLSDIEIMESTIRKLCEQVQMLESRSTELSTNKVPIGEGHALIPSRLFRHINWNSYTSATRKLLTAVFSRRILATHSLTGKPSPAFPNKPAKKKLDPALVNDIVQTVVEKCCVPENVVRTSITTKCADESKMFRTRQKNTRKRKQKTNTENVHPDTTSNSDD
ncbi:hypothetical protein K1T71_009664 [Dendrolimus kikuchii]|uniref:Uncharacterized protein n=1 Tax=Dendrolimus kikuchii TaxID=765133 RepID=A0ACC1CSC7_9NEOP|nr:hypothetical protein K1T71_009664 [Dendrolimus kikuchii]